MAVGQTEGYKKSYVENNFLLFICEKNLNKVVLNQFSISTSNLKEDKNCSL